jgi:hypothetical protein
MIQILVNDKTPIREFETMREALEYGARNPLCCNADSLVFEEFDRNEYSPVPDDDCETCGTCEGSSGEALQPEPIGTAIGPTILEFNNATKNKRRRKTA